ncbi:MAG: hypothetical protein WKF40_08280 [Thermoleophilaceae bacterium]
MEFAQGLADMEIEIVSTGGTARELEQAGIPTRLVEDYTGFPEIMDGRVKTLHPKIYAGLLAVRSDPGHIECAPRAGDRADRPRVREPLSLRARCGPARCGPGRGDREHRHRRTDTHPRGRQEPPVRGGRHFARELRRHPRGAAGRRPADRPAHPRVAGARGLRLHGALRRRDLTLVRRARGGLPDPGEPLLHQGDGPLLRREPPPARRLLRGVRRPHPSALDGVEDPRQGAVVQQPARPRLRPEAPRGVRASRRGHHQAQQSVRGGGGGDGRRGLPACPGHRQHERLWRCDVLQPPHRRRPGASG